jgi:hypothetical protein
MHNPIQKKIKAKKGVAQVAECSPSKHEALSLNPNTPLQKIGAYKWKYLNVNPKKE